MTEITEPMNDVLSPDFKSQLDPYFTSNAPSSIREYRDWEKQQYPEKPKCLPS